MVAILSHRRRFLDKLRTSVLKRTVRAGRGLARFCGDTQEYEIRHYLGAEFRVRRGELIGDEIAINRFEWRELAMMLDACRELKPDFFLDVGANLGLYSCILGKAQVVPRVIAFEPDSENFTQLTDNIRRNDLAAIVDVHPFAVGACRGTARLVPGGPANSGLSRIEESRAGSYDVNVVALDDMLDLLGGTIVAKIDVEGYEIEVLAGSAPLLQNNGGYAQIEGHGDVRAAEITALMERYGWRFIERYGLDLRFERATPRTNA